MVNYSEIIFVLPDHRAIKGKLYITNFRLYFKSDVSKNFELNTCLNTCFEKNELTSNRNRT